MIGKEEFCNKIKQCEASMYYLAYSIVKNKDDASDVVNESILKAYEKLDKLKNEESFKSWILRIVHNTAIELIKKNKEMIDIEEDDNLVEKKVINEKIIVQAGYTKYKSKNMRVFGLIPQEELERYNTINLIRRRQNISDLAYANGCVKSWQYFVTLTF